MGRHARGSTPLRSKGGPGWAGTGSIPVASTLENTYRPGSKGHRIMEAMIRLFDQKERVDSSDIMLEMAKSGASPDVVDRIERIARDLVKSGQIRKDGSGWTRGYR